MLSELELFGQLMDDKSTNQKDKDIMTTESIEVTNSDIDWPSPPVWRSGSDLKAYTNHKLIDHTMKNDKAIFKLCNNTNNSIKLKDYTTVVEWIKAKGFRLVSDTVYDTILCDPLFISGFGRIQLNPVPVLKDKIKKNRKPILGKILQLEDSNSKFIENVMNLEYTIDSQNMEFINEFQAFISQFLFEEESNRGCINVLAQNSNGFYTHEIEKASVKLERGNYMSEVLNAYDYIVDELNTPKPKGSIAILEGDPGTGKTYLIRSIISGVDKAHFLIIPSNLFSQLANPELIPILLNLRNKNQPIVLIIEDADSLLAARMADNMTQISALLNLSDGIVGKLLDIRIIATTNTKMDDIDPAVMRPGRLSQYIHVGKLDKETASGVYKRLTKRDLKVDTSYQDLILAEAYKLAADDELEGFGVKTKKSVGFGS